MVIKLINEIYNDDEDFNLETNEMEQLNNLSNNDTDLIYLEEEFKNSQQNDKISNLIICQDSSENRDNLELINFCENKRSKLDAIKINDSVHESSAKQIQRSKEISLRIIDKKDTKSEFINDWIKDQQVDKDLK